MTVLVVNCGSSSVKFRVYAEKNSAIADCLAEGMVERIGIAESRLKYKAFELGGGFDPKVRAEKVITESIPNHNSALSLVMRILQDKDVGVIKSINEINVVGHRMVHGSDKFIKSIIISPAVKDEVVKCSKFAPLHNPVNLAGVDACEALFPHAKQVGVFDTAFHASLPESSFLYAIPYKYYKEYRIRRYGFHGTSHKYVSERCTELQNTAKKSAERIVVCHLGNGSSMCAVKNGKSLDTTMGFTPLEGLIMGSRVGDIDPGAVLALHSFVGLDFKEIDKVLNKESGFMGITEETSDALIVEQKYLEGIPRHKLAFEMFCNRIKKYIGSYAALMGGLDAVVFTGGIGENAAPVRELVCKEMEFLGLTCDPEKNKPRSRFERTISYPDSKVAVYVIPTNEEWMIAKESLLVVNA